MPGSSHCHFRIVFFGYLGFLGLPVSLAMLQMMGNWSLASAGQGRHAHPLMTE
jgi:hypothetical protein